MTKESATSSKDNAQSTKLSIAKMISTNVEEFRTEASKVFGAFSKKERLILKKLDGKCVESQSVLAAWENELLPLNNNLEEKHKDANFKKSLAKNLYLDKDEIQAELDQIITKRKAEILNKFILGVYPVNKKFKKSVYKKQRKYLRMLVSKPEADILQLKNHQTDYLAYKAAAKKNSIAVIDPCDSKSKRKKVILQIEAEQRQVLTAESDRLYEIKNRLNSITAMSGGVLIDILDKKWDLITILSLRDQYEKAIGKLPKKDANNAIKRLEIFDKETSSFRNEQTNKLVINAEQVSLATARTITKDIDSILLRVFDLTDKQKDQLTQNSKEYSELNKEQAAIIEKQNKRLNR